MGGEMCDFAGRGGPSVTSFCDRKQVGAFVPQNSPQRLHQRCRVTTEVAVRLIDCADFGPACQKAGDALVEVLESAVHALPHQTHPDVPRALELWIQFLLLGSQVLLQLPDDLRQLAMKQRAVVIATQS